MRAYDAGILPEAKTEQRSSGQSAMTLAFVVQGAYCESIVIFGCNEAVSIASRPRFCQPRQHLLLSRALRKGGPLFCGCARQGATVPFGLYSLCLPCRFGCGSGYGVP